MGFLGQFFKQILILFTIIFLPYIWYLFTPIFYSYNLLTFSFGLLIFSESYLYVKLPLDLIPDFIPLVGKFDDAFAYLFMVLGVWISLIGIFSNFITLFT